MEFKYFTKEDREHKFSDSSSILHTEWILRSTSTKYFLATDGNSVLQVNEEVQKLINMFPLANGSTKL